MCKIFVNKQLHCASLNGHTECVKILLAHGADVNSITSNGNTALHYAASWLIYLPFWFCELYIYFTFLH